MAVLEIASAEDYRRLEAKIDELFAEVRGLRQQLAGGAKELLSPAEFSRRYPDWTKGKLGWALFHRDENGLSAAVVQKKRGGRVLIDPEKFFQVVRERGL